MAQEIVQIQQMGDALRNTGYKNISSALAEIVDNSVEAVILAGNEVTNVLILLTEKLDTNTGRKSVREIAILDNGGGMNEEKLGSCLGIGFTTRSERKGMGRFGVGLPQASLHVCPRVSVYSWQKGYDNCKKVWLDIEKVKEGEQTRISDPTFENIGKRYEKFLDFKLNDMSFNFNIGGTMVLWQDCDRVQPKSTSFLMRDLEFYLGQKFRHLIHEGKLNLYLINTDNIDNYRKVSPNDPLFLMEDNIVLGDKNNPGKIADKAMDLSDVETIFEPYGNEKYPNGVIQFPVYYWGKDGTKSESSVKITFSIVKNIFYSQENIAKNAGSTEIGQHAGKLVGISIVRAGREIDFGKFDFFDDVNEPQHRWWGCEISFDPVLDEVFGVANNKQFVELKRVDLLEYNDEEIKPVWLQLYPMVHSTIKAMYDNNKTIRKDSRTNKQAASPSEQIVNEAEKDNNSDSLSKIIKGLKTENELIEETKNAIIKDNPNYTDEELSKLAKEYIENKVNFVYKKWGRAGQFFDLSAELGTITITINVEHEFYKNFFEKVCVDPDVKTTFELFIASYAVASDELDVVQQDQNENLLEEWNNKLKLYIKKQLGKI